MTILCVYVRLRYTYEYVYIAKLSITSYHLLLSVPMLLHFLYACVCMCDTRLFSSYFAYSCLTSTPQHQQQPMLLSRPARIPYTQIVYAYNHTHVSCTYFSQLSINPINKCGKSSKSKTALTSANKRST